MTAITHTTADLHDELNRGGKIILFSGTATAWLILVQRETDIGTWEAWAITP